MGGACRTALGKERGGFAPKNRLPQTLASGWLPTLASAPSKSAPLFAAAISGRVDGGVRGGGAWFPRGFSGGPRLPPRTHGRTGPRLRREALRPGQGDPARRGRTAPRCFAGCGHRARAAPFTFPSASFPAPPRRARTADGLTSPRVVVSLSVAVNPPCRMARLL